MSNVIISYRQCKAARELLDWRQLDLSKKSKISLGTIADFERGVRSLRMDTLEKLICAFAKAGIKFENDSKICSVELKK